MTENGHHQAFSKRVLNRLRIKDVVILRHFDANGNLLAEIVPDSSDATRPDWQEGHTHELWYNERLMTRSKMNIYDL